MNLKLTSLALASVLSANRVAGTDDVDTSLTNRVGSAHPHNNNLENITTQRRAERFMLASNDNKGAAGRIKSEPDVGIFGGSRGRRKVLFPHRRRAAASHGSGRRFLDTVGVEYACSQYECEPKLCECVNAGGKAYDCKEELHALCGGVEKGDGTGAQFTIDTCVSYPKYYREAYCPFVECLVDGGETLEKCDCDFYDAACSLYVDSQEFRNDKEVVQNCAVAACCKTKSDDEGRATCFEKAPSSQPSMMLGDSTKSPTPRPTFNVVNGGSGDATEPTIATPIFEPVVGSGGGSANGGDATAVVGSGGGSTNGGDASASDSSPPHSPPDSSADITLPQLVGGAPQASDKMEIATGAQDTTPVDGTPADNTPATSAAPVGEDSPVPPNAADAGSVASGTVSVRAAEGSSSAPSMGIVGSTTSVLAATIINYFLC